jgi:hypothetical protein
MAKKAFIVPATLASFGVFGGYLLPIRAIRAIRG